MLNPSKLKPGDVVRVKPNVKDPDFANDIGGWQGRVTDIKPQNNLVRIDLDSLTLAGMPDSIIKQCEKKGVAWNQIYLNLDDVEPATARDTDMDVVRVMDTLEAKHAWDHLEEQGGRIISEVLAGISLDDEWGAFKAWEAHLRKVLHLPFESEVEEFQEDGPLEAGDSVMVEKITNVDDTYGVIVAVKHKRRKYKFPLCDLEATDKKSANYKIVQAYAVWFANRF